MVVAEAPVDACVDYEVMALIERFGNHMPGYCRESANETDLANAPR